MMAPTFRKRERLVSQKLIDQLFGGGHSHSLAAFPLRAVYLATGRQATDEPVQLLISVPKKRFRHAVDRNRVKRQVREAYRRHKQLLHDAVPADQTLLLAFVWLADSHFPTANVEQQAAELLRRIARKL